MHSGDPRARPATLSQGRRVAVAIALGCALTVSSPIARADDLDDFVFARDAYTNNDYDISRSRLELLLSPTRQPPLREDLVEPAQKFLFACLVLTEHRGEATTLLERMLRTNPDLQFNLRDFSAPVLELVQQTRERMLPELTHLREQRLDARRDDEARRARERQQILDAATTEVTHVPRWMMFVPLGFGQFANDSPGLGVLFGGVASLSLATAIAVYTFNYAWLPTTCYNPLDGRITSSCEAPFLAVNIAAWSVFGLAIIGGIVQANLAYQSDRVTNRRRPVPPALEHIQISADPHGVGLGMTLRF